MNRGDKLKLLQSRISNVENKLPIMLIGEAADLFRENYSGSILKPRTNLELCEVVNNSKTTGKPLVFEFSSFLSDTSLIDCIDSYSNLFILTEDTSNISIKLLLKIKTLVKFSEASSSKLQGAKISEEDWKVEDDKSNIAKFMAKNSPEWYYYKNKYSMTKYIDLFSSD